MIASRRGTGVRSDGLSETRFKRWLRTAPLCALVAAVLHAPHSAYAQAGPPFLTNVPGTPGNGNWEINLASMQSISRGTASYQVPQIDLNFGLGDRIQLTYEVPCVVQTTSGQPVQSGWSNACPGGQVAILGSGRGRLANV